MTNGNNDSGRPTGEARITMYDVGFGDSFLLTIPYRDGTDRHVLIDCGTSTEKAARMAVIAREIESDCGGKLDALVATHRHSDHISAFGWKAPGEILEGLNPELVVMPWTEHLDVGTEDTRPPEIFTEKAFTQLASMREAQRFAEEVFRARRALQRAADDDLDFIAELNIYNKRALTRLHRMGKRHAFVHTGSDSGLEALLPGVKVHVLGPPTLAQTTSIRTQVGEHDTEFWGLLRRLAASAGGSRKRKPFVLFDAERGTEIDKAPSQVKWLIEQMDVMQTRDVRRIMEGINSWLNNTSVVLLFDVGGKKLLFPGDAQLENWEYALSNGHRRNRLKNTLVYKVGHHGSTNATPKKLWGLFDRRSDTETEGRLVSLLSTRYHKHHGVPRKSLVDALKAGTLHESTVKVRAEGDIKKTIVL